MELYNIQENNVELFVLIERSIFISIPNTIARLENYMKLNKF